MPQGGDVSATIRRPLGQTETTQIAFSETELGRFLSTEPVVEGRWIVRLKIGADGQNWSTETRIE